MLNKYNKSHGGTCPECKHYKGICSQLYNIIAISFVRINNKYKQVPTACLPACLPAWRQTRLRVTRCGFRMHGTLRRHLQITANHCQQQLVALPRAPFPSSRNCTHYRFVCLACIRLFPFAFPFDFTFLPLRPLPRSTQHPRNRFGILFPP